MHMSYDSGVSNVFNLLPLAAPSVIGPAMPPGFKLDQSEGMDEDEDMIGPVPHTGDQSDYSSSAAADFERRAQAMKNKLNNPVKKRNHFFKRRDLQSNLRFSKYFLARHFQYSW